MACTGALHKKEIFVIVLNGWKLLVIAVRSFILQKQLLAERYSWKELLLNFKSKIRDYLKL